MKKAWPGLELAGFHTPVMFAGSSLSKLEVAITQ
jgi:hypothetical protein